MSDATPTPNIPHSVVLVLSHDAVAAALLGALVETLGYAVKFAQAPEGAEGAIRRTRPKVALIDCDDPESCSDEIIGRAAMRGVCVIVFGRTEALDRLRAFALEHSIETLLMPPAPPLLERLLRDSVAS